MYRNMVQMIVVYNIFLIEHRGFYFKGIQSDFLSVWGHRLKRKGKDNTKKHVSFPI